MWSSSLLSQVRRIPAKTSHGWRGRVLRGNIRVLLLPICEHNPRVLKRKGRVVLSMAEGSLGLPVLESTQFLDILRPKRLGVMGQDVVSRPTFWNVFAMSVDMADFSPARQSSEAAQLLPANSELSFSAEWPLLRFLSFLLILGSESRYAGHTGFVPSLRGKELSWPHRVLSTSKTLQLLSTNQQANKFHVDPSWAFLEPDW